MRNLKRALSLALAAIMLIGMMAIGTSAASVSDFTDAEKITNLEAASVTTAIGIFDGYSDGSFGGEDYVTRAQMATIVCKILSGANVNADIYKGSGKFQDLAGNEWAEGYINMCASLGIITGTSETTFEPGRPVKTWEAALMLQRALGWWAGGEAINELAVTAKSSALSMYGDLVLSIEDYLTRNDVAELVFNTITKAVPVEYNDSFQLYRNASSPSVFSGVVYNYADTLAYNTFGLVYAVGDADAFGRPATTWGYGKLDASNDIDSDGDIDSSFTIDSAGFRTSLVTVAETPVREYTTTVTGRALYDDLGLHESGNTIDLALFVDGYNSEGSLQVTVARSNNAGLTVSDKDLTGNGVLTQVFVNDAFDSTAPVSVTNSPYIVVVINTYIMDVVSVTEATRTDSAYVTVDQRAATVGDTTRYATQSDYAYNDGTKLDRNFNTEDFFVNDVVLVTVALDDKDSAVSGTNQYKIQTMELAESLQGEMTRYTETAKTMRVDGVTYSFNFMSSQNANRYNSDGSKVGTDVQVYLDQYGYAIEVDGITAEAQDNYALVLAVDEDSADVFNNNSAWVKLLLMDGTIDAAKFTWDDDEVDDDKQWDYDNLINKDIDITGNDSANARAYIHHETKDTLWTNIQTLVKYTKDGDTYTLYTLGAEGDTWGGLTTDTNRSVASDHHTPATKLFMNNSTVLIMPSNKNRDQYDIYTGVRTMPKINEDNPSGASNAPTMVAQEGGTSLVNVIYTEAGVDEEATEDLIYIAGPGSPEYVNDKDLGAYCNFIAVINGEIVELMVRGTANNEGVVSTTLVEEGHLYSSLNYKGDIVTGATLSDGNGYHAATGIIAAKKDVIGVGVEPSVTYYTWSDDVLVAYIDDVNGSIVVTNPRVTSLKTDSTAAVLYGTSNNNAGEITWLYVINSSVGVPITAGGSKTYDITGLRVGDLILISDGTNSASVVIEKIGGAGSDKDDPNFSAAVGALSLTGYTLSLDDNGYLVVKAKDSRTDIESITVQSAAPSAADDEDVGVDGKASASLDLSDASDITSLTSVSINSQSISVTDATKDADGETTDQNWHWYWDATDKTLSVVAVNAGDTLNNKTLTATVDTSDTRTESTAGGYSVTSLNDIDDTYGGKCFDLSSVGDGDIILIDGTQYAYTDGLDTTLAGLLTDGIDGCTVLLDGTNLLILKDAADSDKDIDNIDVLVADTIDGITAEEDKGA